MKTIEQLEKEKNTAWEVYNNSGPDDRSEKAEEFKRAVKAYEDATRRKQ